MAGCGMDRSRAYEFLPEEVASAAAASQQAPILGGTAFNIDFDGQQGHAEEDLCGDGEAPSQAKRHVPFDHSSATSSEERAKQLATAVGEWRVCPRVADAADLPQASGVKVMVRVRPFNDAEQQPLVGADARGVPHFPCISILQPGLVALHVEELGCGGAPTGRLRTTISPLHCAFPTDSADEEVCDALEPIILEAIHDGKAAHVLHYGPTGTGKTHTARAVTKRLVDALVQQLCEGEQPLALRMFESVGDRCFDLLGDRREIHSRDDGSGRVCLQGLASIASGCGEELHAALEAGFCARRTGETEMNATSSRSHAICELSFCVAGSHERLVRIVDLAGSERSRDVVLHSAEQLRETKDVNWSLSCLRECVRSAARTAQGKPSTSFFRRSKLTLLLRDCFEPGTCCIWMGHLSPTSKNLAATRNTLKCAADLVIVAREERSPVAAAPQSWSKAQLHAWLQRSEGGRFAHVADAFRWANGRTLNDEWLPDLVARCGASGATEGDVTAVYEAFHALNAAALKKSATE